MTLLRRGLPALATALAGLAVGVAATSWGAPAQRPWDPPPDTIVRVTGDQADGFSVFHLDGSAQFTPTRSEADAECGEYDARLERARCRTGVRTWYRDLGRLRRALRYAHRTG